MQRRMERWGLTTFTGRASAWRLPRTNDEVLDPDAKLSGVAADFHCRSHPVGIDAQDDLSARLPLRAMLCDPPRAVPRATEGSPCSKAGGRKQTSCESTCEVIDEPTHSTFLAHNIRRQHLDNH